jgi:tRNA_anti-like
MASRKSKLIIFGFAAFLIVISILVAYKMYTKPHRSVEREKGIEVSAVQLFDQFEQNEVQANTKYLDKVIEVTGKVSEVGTNLDNKPIVMLETNSMLFGIRCTMADSLLAVEPGATVTIKGICTGYLSDVVLTSGIIVENKE